MNDRYQAVNSYDPLAATSRDLPHDPLIGMPQSGRRHNIKS